MAAPSDDTIDPALVTKAENYLNDIRTIRAAFTQIAPDGSIVNGRFFMERPGKMRWQYNPPVPVLILSRGSFLRYIDYELEQVSDIPLEDTLASMLASKHVNFHDPSIKVLHADNIDGVATITVTQRDAPDDGILGFEFDTTPFSLRNIHLTDAKGDDTTISLSGADYNVTLDDELFTMIDPRLQWRKGRR